MEENQEQYDPSTLVVGETKNGKPIVAKRHNNGLYFLEMQGGGKKPAALQGEFTNQESVREAVNAYLVKASYVYKRNARKKAEEESHGKNTD